MVKSIVVTLSVTIPDTALSQNATVTVGTGTYAGVIKAILTHEDITTVPASTTVKLTGLGLAVTP